MKITLSNNLNLNIITREDDRKSQDESIIAEVIFGDCYWLTKIKSLKPKVLLDIGGHIGCWGIYAKSIFPDARLIAVEPNIESYELYKRNAEINKLTNYEIINAAVEYNQENNVLLQGLTSTGGCRNITKDSANKIIQNNKSVCILEQEVKFVTIEDLLKDIDHVDISKWDSEGAELRAFENMIPETREKFEILVGEYHTNKSPKQLRSDLTNLFPNHHVKINNREKIGWFRITKEK